MFEMFTKKLNNAVLHVVKFQTSHLTYLPRSLVLASNAINWAKLRFDPVEEAFALDVSWGSTHSVTKPSFELE